MTYIDTINLRLEVMDPTAITMCMEHKLPIHGAQPVGHGRPQEGAVWQEGWDDRSLRAVTRNP